MGRKVLQGRSRRRGLSALGPPGSVRLPPAQKGPDPAPSEVRRGLRPSRFPLYSCRPSSPSTSIGRRRRDHPRPRGVRGSPFARCGESGRGSGRLGLDGDDDPLSEPVISAAGPVCPVFGGALVARGTHRVGGRGVLHPWCDLGRSGSRRGSAALDCRDHRG